jgi:SAM-dependent methyltransferase/methyltransferase-like protein
MLTGKDSYDAVAYPGFPYPDTHPDRLAVMAILHGLSPALVARCRVLEIACGEGANLIPMAYAAPDSEFVGFDLAGRPIERGQQRIRDLALTNVRLFQGDLLEAGPELGQFDYAIAHGVYSWVPEPVRARLLALCRESLAPNGIAFVSYATLPGGHLRNMIREIMLFRVRGMEDPQEKVSSALAFLRFVMNARKQGDPFRALIEEQLKSLEKRNPYALFHDELGEIHEPLLFTEFVDHVRRNGLQYLCEAVLPPPPDAANHPELAPTLANLAGDDLIAHEQVLDFLRMRMYRETLLCPAERELRRDPAPESFRRLLFSSQASSARATASGAKIFTLPGGIKMETSHPAVIALVDRLEAAWPRALSFAEMEPGVSAAGFSLDQDGAALLMRLVIAKFIELRAWKAPLAPAISSRPRASAIARHEARTRAHVTTLLHTTARLDDPLVRSFLQLLDGTRDRASVLNALRAAHPDVPIEQLERGIEPNLKFLHRAGLLEA